MALDAQEERIAGGDVSGRIHLWNGFGAALAAAAGASSGGANDQPGQLRQSGKKRDIRDANLAKETLHWHAAAVTSLAFSTDGTYLLSGGREAVLVRLLYRVIRYANQNQQTTGTGCEGICSCSCDHEVCVAACVPSWQNLNDAVPTLIRSAGRR